MHWLLKKIGSLFLYREQKNEELGFELLEGKNEGMEFENVHAYKDDIQRSTGKEDNKSKKDPLTVEEWNGIRKSQKTRNHENDCKPQHNTDKISTELCLSISILRQKFHMSRNKDVIIREFNIGRKVNAFIVYVEGMIDKQTLNFAILPQLMSKDVFDEIGEVNPIDYLMQNILTVYRLAKTNKYTEVISQVLCGVSALFVEGCNECILIETREYEKRNVEQPKTETVVRGPHEGFTENLRTNVTLIRRIIKNENLMTELLPVGNTNHSSCAVLYLDGIANPKVIEEVKNRIKSIDADFVMGDGMVEQFIEDNTFMLIPQVMTTERPDRTAASIMEGQVVILAEGTPFSIAVPVTIFHLLHTSEDSFMRWPLGSFLRLIRLLGFLCSLLLPGIYVATVLFHPEMLPTELLNSFAKAKEVVPFPTVMEVLVLEISFELIREGGIRVPSVIGQTLGIVGALILGQAAVSAGLVSPIVVIITSLTALGSFTIPNYTLGISLRIERFLFIFAATCLGFYGVSLMIVLLTLTMCSMKSFGVPIFAPVAPRTNINFDIIFRGPIWKQKKRPDQFNTANRKTQDDKKDED